MEYKATKKFFFKKGLATVFFIMQDQSALSDDVIFIARKKTFKTCSLALLARQRLLVKNISHTLLLTKYAMVLKASLLRFQTLPCESKKNIIHFNCLLACKKISVA